MTRILTDDRERKMLNILLDAELRAAHWPAPHPSHISSPAAVTAYARRSAVRQIAHDVLGFGPPDTSRLPDTPQNFDRKLDEWVRSLRPWPTAGGAAAGRRWRSDALGSLGALMGVDIEPF